MRERQWKLLKKWLRKMDKYFKWIIFFVILLVVTAGLTVYFSFYYNPDVGLSPSEDNTQANNSSNDSGGLTIDERGSKDFERPANSSPAGNNTNKSGYWIQHLPDSGGGTYSITPLIVYDKLAKTKNWMVILVIVLGVIIYIVFKIRGRVVKKELSSRFAESL